MNNYEVLALVLEVLYRFGTHVIGGLIYEKKKKKVSG